MHRIGFVVFPDFQLMDMTATTVFEVANLTTGNRIYSVTLLSEIGGPVLLRQASPWPLNRSASRPSIPLWSRAALRLVPSRQVHRLHKAIVQSLEARRSSLHRCLCPGRGGPARRPTRHHALALRARSAKPVPQSQSGGRSHLCRRRPRMDVSRHGGDH